MEAGRGPRASQTPETKVLHLSLGRSSKDLRVPRSHRPGTIGGASAARTSLTLAARPSGIDSSFHPRPVDAPSPSPVGGLTPPTLANWTTVA